MNGPTLLRFALLTAGLPLAAQLPGLPKLPGLPPPPPDPIEVVRQFMKIDPARMLALKGQVKAPEVDLPGALWVSSRASVSPEVVIQSRLGGLSWMDIFLKFKVPVAQVIVPVQRASCPPYGKAWGYRRKHGGRGGPPGRMEAEDRFSDEDIADFINLRAVSGVYGASLEDLAVRRCAGKGMRDLIGEEHEKKHGKGHGEGGDKHKEKKHGKGHGNDDGDNDDDHPGKGHGKGHGGKD